MRDLMMHELELLAINKHIPSESLKQQAENWRTKYEYSDAYDQTMGYLKQAELCEQILRLRNKYGVTQ